jgi:hypothetical protein
MRTPQAWGILAMTRRAASEQSRTRIRPLELTSTALASLDLIANREPESWKEIGKTDDFADESHPPFKGRWSGHHSESTHRFHPIAASAFDHAPIAGSRATIPPALIRQPKDISMS